MVQRQQYIDREIDNLTNSFENIITGDSFATDIIITAQNDFKSITKKRDNFLIGNQNSKSLIGTFLNGPLLIIKQ